MIATTLTLEGALANKWKLKKYFFKILILLLIREKQEISMVKINPEEILVKFMQINKLRN